MTRLASILFIASLLLWIIYDFRFRGINQSLYIISKILFFISLFLFAIALIIKIGKIVSKPFTKNRCKRCDAIIPKGHIYCSEHEKEVADEAREVLEQTWTKKGLK